MSSDLRFDVRFIVFTVDDIYEAIHRLTKSARKAVAEPGTAGYISLHIERAARWTIREERDRELPLKRAHLAPLMFNLFFLFPREEELVETLLGLTQALHYDLPGPRAKLEAGLSGHVPGTGQNGPMGLWQLTPVHPEAPSAYRFSDSPIWDY
jgi:hypothetical protein